MSSPKASAYMAASLYGFIAGTESGFELQSTVERAGKAYGFEGFDEGSI
ncbi:hypothetical protein A176_005441 [Myxococcus hansupus]|uniref:Uncharacterized protein n=1 Tax=Pseudomyxococcus hansupus TaxID=1297742 RepID=A0A0H4X0C0_9BACT|nr:hypothetical protein [Myxococcus hansupus]AKQ68529.1 hypothetical protein A176_005441 [Myxococcus hansupus]